MNFHCRHGVVALMVAVSCSSATADETARSYFQAHHSVTDGWGPFDVKFEMVVTQSYQGELYAEIISRCRLRADPDRNRWAFVREDRLETVARPDQLDRDPRHPSSTYSLRGGVLFSQNGKLRMGKQHIDVQLEWISLGESFEDSGFAPDLVADVPAMRRFLGVDR